MPDDTEHPPPPLPKRRSEVKDLPPSEPPEPLASTVKGGVIDPCNRSTR